MSITPELETLTTDLAADTGELRILDVDPLRASTIRAAYTTRFVAAEFAKRPENFQLLAGADVQPQPGDVVIARVSEIGKHKRLETPHSRRALMFTGQEIMVAYGNRATAKSLE